MIRKDLLKTIITDSQQRPLPLLWQRTLKIPINSGKIITLTGVRRSGKTSHLFNLMQELKAGGVASERLLYLNFEDERWQASSDDLDMILQAYQELHPDLSLADCYFFFDEIQEAEGWEKFIARLYASISQNIFITGSNARLLSQEIATALRGRTITLEVYPLSFLEFSQALLPDFNLHASADKARLVSLFERFLTGGGFPEIVNQQQDLREKILQEYFNVMVFRDLVERYRIAQPALLKYFCKRVIGASAGEFSVNKIYNELKSQGYQVSKDTVYAYQGYVEAIYLNRLVPKYSPSVVKAEGSQKKNYVIDSGLGSALDYKLSHDRGRLLETVTALELIKRGKQIAYFQNGGECDFVVVEKGVLKEAIQVTAEFDAPQTRQRELRGLTQACQKNSLKEGVIITFDHEEQLELNGVQISVVPAWKYFLTLA